ncbi:unnamed protein product, partial [Polarella glacialis]
MASVVGLVDPASCRTIEVSSQEYWKKPFNSVCMPAKLTEFVVLDVIADESAIGEIQRAPGSRSGRNTSRGKVNPCEIEIARSSDFGQN